MKLLVIGNPIKHSKSPMIHNYWIKKYKIKGIYEKLKIEENNLWQLIDELKKGKLKGINVTLPYKEKIITLLDKLDSSAKVSQAVNTIFLDKNEKAVGANTDGVGFVSYLTKDLNVKLKDKNFYILGAGGSSLGIISELVKHGISSITIVNRTIKKAESLAKKFSSSGIPITVHDWKLLKPGKNIDVVVNTSSFGMKNTDVLSINSSKLKKETLILDIIYEPRETEFLKQLKKEKFKTHNGIGMLIRQAAESFNFWFNISLKKEDIENVRKIIENK